MASEWSRAYDEGGIDLLSEAMDLLAKDPVRSARVPGAIFPREMREAIKDQMAEQGMTEEDLRDLIRKLERGPAIVRRKRRGPRPMAMVARGRSRERIYIIRRLGSGSCPRALLS
jgi:hypothetical protein